MTCESVPSLPGTDSSIMGSPSRGLSTLGSASPTLGDEKSSPCAGPESPSSMMCEQSMVLRLASIFASEVSPAEEQAPPATARAWEIQRLLSGERWPGSFANYDPDSSCWRTSQTSLLSSEVERGERFLGTWPRSGMCVAGTVYPLPPLAPRTSAIGSSPLLPTPMARTKGGAEVSGKSRTGGPMLAGALLPTPVSQDGKNATAPSQAHRKSPPLTHILLPTPAKADGERSSETYGAGNLTPRGSVLTPLRSSDGKKSPAPLLNPCFVEWMLGLPAGWSDPDCPLSAMEFKSKSDAISENASSTSREAA